MALTTAQIQQAYVTFFSRPADAAGLNYWSSYAGSVSDLYATFAQQTEYTAVFNGLSSAQKVNAVYQNLFGRDAEPTGLLYWAKQLDSGAVTVASLALTVSAGSQGTDSSIVANRVTAATAFTAALDTTAKILGYSGAAANASAKAWLSTVVDTAASLTTATAGVATAVTNTISVGGAAGSTFTLTTGADNFVATSGTDTFNATVGNTTTLSALDKLVGGAGNDTLNITVDTGTATLNGADVSGIENIAVRNVGGGAASVDASAAPGVTNVIADRGTGSMAATNLPAGSSYSIVGNGVVTLGTQAPGYVAAATSATINVSGGTVSTGTITETGTGLLSTTINSTGTAKNTVGAVTLAASMTGALTINAAAALTTGAVTQTGADAATSLVVTGAGAVDVSAGALPATIVKVDASASTGGLSVVTNNTAAGTSTAAGLTVTGSSAADVIDIRNSDAADYVTVNTGAGADTVKITNAQIAAAAPNFTVTGNSGSTLVIDFADTTATQAADLSKAFVGFGAIDVISSNANAKTETLAMAANKLTVSNISWDGDAADTFTLTGLAANQTVTINTNAAAINATIGTDTKSDTLNLVLNGTTTAGTVTATNYETLNIASNTDKSANTNAFNALTASSATSVVITGSASLSTGTLTTAANATVDATGMTVAAITGGTTLTTTLTSATTAFKGGPEVDALTLGAGTLAQGFSYDGGSGADTITVSATSAQNAGILALSNFKTVAVTTHANAVDTETFDLRNVTNVTNMTFTAGDGGDNLTLNHVKPGQVITATGTTAFGTVNLNADSGTSQALAFGNSLTVATLNADAGATSLALSEVTGKTATLTNPIGGSSLTTITLTGAGSFALGGTQATNVTTIDGSALSAGTVSATLGAVAGTLKGGAGADTLTGGSKADTINGGAGADTIISGGGLDTLTGGDTTSLDTFEITGAVAGSATSQITITDFATAAAHTATAAIIADTLQLSKTSVLANGNGAINNAATSLSGAASLSDALNLLATGDGHSTSIVAWGVYNGDTYVVVDNSAASTLQTADAVIKLVGVTNLAAADMSIIA
jgi:hypothetical protein